MIIDCHANLRIVEEHEFCFIVYLFVGEENAEVVSDVMTAIKDTVDREKI
jgi:hypothetical protein